MCSERSGPWLRYKFDVIHDISVNYRNMSLLNNVEGKMRVLRF